MVKAYKLLILDYGGVYSFEYSSSNFNKIIFDAFGKIPSQVDRLKIIEQSHLLGANKMTTHHYISTVAALLETPDPDLQTLRSHLHEGTIGDRENALLDMMSAAEFTGQSPEAAVERTDGLLGVALALGGDKAKQVELLEMDYKIFKLINRPTSIRIRPLINSL